VRRKPRAWLGVVGLIGVVVVVLLIASFAHDVEVGLIGFVVGVLVASIAPPLWRWVTR
jgi:Na+/H+ antiporter NhaB